MNQPTVLTTVLISSYRNLARSYGTWLELQILTSYILNKTKYFKKHYEQKVDQNKDRNNRLHL